MKFLVSTLLAGLLSSVVMHDAASQTVYRCGSVYTQVPCEHGRIVEATDPRTAAQRAEAKRVVADERRLADDMRRDRLAEQAAFRPGPASLSGAPISTAKREVVVAHHQAKKKRAVKKTDATDDFVAVDTSTLKRRSKK